MLVHGAAEDSRIWEPQLAGLADDFAIVAWDEPGAGRSSDLPDGFGLAGFAKGWRRSSGPSDSALRTSPACPGAARWCSSSIAATPDSSQR